MSQIWQPQPIEVYKQWVEAIESESLDKLNNWETEFLSSISNRLDSGRTLTEGQATKLEAIYTEYTS